MLPYVGLFEFLVVALVALLFFGHRLPTLARALGQSLLEFKQGLHGIEADQGK